MFDEIISIDRDLFFAINGTHSYFTDCVIWALIMGYSRIYLGVHYVFDVLGGMIVGSFIVLPLV